MGRRSSWAGRYRRSTDLVPWPSYATASARRADTGHGPWKSKKRLLGRVDGPLLHGMLAGCAIMVISSLGLFYLWHSAREAQLDAVRTELTQLARVAATLVDATATG